MQKRQLGESPVHVTPVIFGAWAIGGWMWGGADESDAISAIHAGIEEGVNTIDTAPIYGMGRSEELVGRAIKGKRDKVVIATKCGLRWDTEEGSEPWKEKDLQGRDIVIRKNAKPLSIAYECDQSLRRLGVDVIDLYQIHRPDTSTPVEESIGALEKLRKAGKVRAIGVSNYDVEWLRRAQMVAPITSLQPPYSLIQRKIEEQILPFCRQHHIGAIVYSPLERGLLTGKVGPDRQFAPGDHRAQHKYFSAENRKRVMKALELIRPIADQHKASFAQLVINWTIHQPGVTAALVGARNSEQARHNAHGMRLELAPQELDAIRAAFDSPAREMNLK